MPINVIVLEQLKGPRMTTQTTHNHPSSNHRLRRFAPLFTGLAALAALIASPSPASAQNQLLTDPGAETSTATLSTFVGWTQWGGGGAYVGPGDTGVAANSGTNFFKIWGNFGNANNYSGFFQTFGASPGQKFNASGYIYQNSGDGFAAGNPNRVYLEVQFKDISGGILADYQSGMFTNGNGWPQNTWISWPVTNEVSPNPGLVSNLVAPANTVQVEFDIVFNTVNWQGGSVYLDDLSLLSYAPPPPYITNMSPANVILATNQNFTFGAVAQSGNITNIQVTVTATAGINGTTTTTNVFNLASANLTLSGLGTPSVTGSIPLSANAAYNINVLAVDSNGGTAVSPTTFDTIQPVLVWEAEDFNYSDGQWVTTTPLDGGVNLYAGLVGDPGTDEQWITASGQSDLYRTTDKVSIGGAYETPRQKFLNAIADGSNTNALDYEVGYNSATDWLNYTRTFPAGNYNIYARLATVGAGAQLTMGVVGGDPTTQNQTVTNLGSFTFTDNGWNNYDYVPMADSFGNLITVHLSGTETLRTTIVPGGNPNINFYMIVPATGSPNPKLISSYPTGSHPFEPTNKFSVTVGPAQGSVISTNGIHLSLNGVDVSGELSFSAGVSNQWTATVPVALNTIYQAVVLVTNTTSLHSTFTINFDTFSETNFMFEAEDYDFGGGQFYDNPVPSFDPTITGGGLVESESYVGATAVLDIDFGWGSVAGETQDYRPDDVGTQPASDYLRQKFIDAQSTFSDVNISDVNLGYWNGGFWQNYTRTYPTGNFYVYGRLAGGNGAFSGTTLAMVTSGAGTSTQTTNILGSFADPNAVGWQTWHWIPLLNASGNMVSVPLSGVATLQAESGGNINANYFMLVPAPAPAGVVTLTVALAGNQPAIKFPTVLGHNYTLLYKSNLTDATWTAVTSVAGDGTVKTLTDTTASGAAHRFYTVQIQ